MLALVGLLLLGACQRTSPEAQALARGAVFLAEIQRPDGAICDTVNPLFDIWETVEAATALWQYRRDTSDTVLQKALAFLQTHENSAGMLCHNRKCRASYCLETTAEYFILLADIHGPQYIQARMDTLRKLQKPSGEWAIGNPDVLEMQAFPSVTGFVLAAFQAAGMQPLYPEAAVTWLASQQQPDGDWGAAWEYYGCTAYALWPILRALDGEHDPVATAAVAKAIHYIDSHQQQGQYWDSTTIGPKKVSLELQTALMLNALDASEKSDAQVQGGIDFLVQRQQADGHWDGGDFPIANVRYQKEEYVFATARAMVAIGRHAGAMEGPSP